MRHDLLVFSLGQQRFGLPVRQISTVVPRPSLTPLPSSPEHLIGMLCLRGALFGVIDIRPVLGLPVTAPKTGECIVLMLTSTSKVGLLVESVEGLVSVAADPVGGASGHRLIRRMLENSGHVIAELDVDAVVGNEIAAYVAGISSGARAA